MDINTATKTFIIHAQDVDEQTDANFVVSNSGTFRQTDGFGIFVLDSKFEFGGERVLSLAGSVYDVNSATETFEIILQDVDEQTEVDFQMTQSGYMRQSDGFGMRIDNSNFTVGDEHIVSLVGTIFDLHTAENYLVLAMETDVDFSMGWSMAWRDFDGWGVMMEPEDGYVEI
jgi:hypothetical protein